MSISFRSKKYADPEDNDDDDNDDDNLLPGNNNYHRSRPVFERDNISNRSSQSSLPHQRLNLSALSMQENTIKRNDDAGGRDDHRSVSSSQHSNKLSDPLIRIGRREGGTAAYGHDANENDRLSSSPSSSFMRGNNKRLRPPYVDPEENEEDDDDPVEMPCDTARRQLLKDDPKSDPHNRSNCFLCIRKIYVTYQDPVAVVSPPPISPALPVQSSGGGGTGDNNNNNNNGVVDIDANLVPSVVLHMTEQQQRQQQQQQLSSTGEEDNHTVGVLPSTATLDQFLPRKTEHSRIFFPHSEDSNNDSEGNENEHAPTKLDFRYQQISDDIIFALNQRIKDAMTDGNFESECMIIANWFNEQTQKINDERSTYKRSIDIPRLTGVDLKNHYLYHQNTTDIGIFKKHREMDDIMDQLKQDIFVESKKTKRRKINHSTAKLYLSFLKPYLSLYDKLSNKRSYR